jgi:hypothetical protein
MGVEELFLRCCVLLSVAGKAAGAIAHQGSPGVI